MNSHFYLLALIASVRNTSAAHKEVLICPGYCSVSESECLEGSGRPALGVCFESKFCCMPAAKDLHTCGTLRKDLQDSYYFVSPAYPAPSSGDLLCTFSMKLKENVVKITIDFVAFSSDGITYNLIGPTCDTDHLYIQGFDGFMPKAYCGHLSGYQLVIDDHATVSMKNLTLIAIMSSKSYRWLIQIRQFTSLTCDKGEDIVESDVAAPRQPTSSLSPLNGSVFSATAATTTVRYTRDAYGSVGVFVNHHRDLLIDNELQELPQTLPMVIQGSDGNAGDFPWQASIRINLSIFPKSTHTKFVTQGCDAQEGLHICGGSIISETEILTAAHCFEPQTKLAARLSPWVFKIVVGDVNKCKEVDEKGRKKRNLSVQEFRVDKIMLHYDYSAESGNINDVAVVKILGKINFNKNVQKIALADPDSHFEKRKVIVSGWGKTLADPSNLGSDILQFSRDMSVTPRPSCKKAILNIMGVIDEKIFESSGKYKHVLRSMICISSTDKNSTASAAQGDSGGPVIVYEGKKKPKPILIGIVSMGEVLNPKLKKASPVNYLTNVAHYRNWIDTSTCA